MKGDLAYYMSYSQYQCRLRLRLPMYGTVYVVGPRNDTNKGNTIDI